MRLSAASEKGLPAAALNVLAIIFGSTIVLWPLGLDQIAPPLIALLGAGWLVIRYRHTLRVPVAVWVYCGFLLLTLLPAARVRGFEQWLVYLRFEVNMVAGLSVLFLAASLASVHQRRLWRLLSVYTIVVALGAGVAVAGVGRTPFTTTISRLLPRSVEASNFVQDKIAAHQFGRKPGEHDPARAQSIYLEPSKLGVAALPLLALGLALFTVGGRDRVLSIVAILASTFLQIVAVTRLPIFVSVVVFGLGYVTLRLVRRFGWRRLRRVILVVVLIGVGGSSIRWPGHDSLTERLMFGVRPDSAVSRLHSYMRSLSTIASRPWIGSGTQQVDEARGVGGHPLREGTGSEYLNVAYRFGLLGLVAYLAIWTAVLWSSRKRLRSAMDDALDGRSHEAILWLGAGMIAIGLAAVFHGLQWDANLYLLCTLLAGCVLACARMTSIDEFGLRDELP